MMSSCPQNRIQAAFFPIFKQVGHVQEVEILPGVKRQMKTLSMRPLVFGKMEIQEVIEFYKTMPQLTLQNTIFFTLFSIHFLGSLPLFL